MAREAITDAWKEIMDRADPNTVADQLRKVLGPGVGFGTLIQEMNSAINNGAAKDIEKVLEISAEITGTGSEQSVSHSLGAVPTVVLPFWTNQPDSAVTFEQGTHTDAAALVTVTATAKCHLLILAMPS